MKRKLYNILENKEYQSTTAQWFDILLIAIIVLNILALMMETVNGIYEKNQALFTHFEYFSVAVFTIEYLIRLWVAPLSPKNRLGWQGRLDYIKSPMAIIDLLAVLPFYIIFLNVDFRFFRIFRLTRIFRLLKVGRYFQALQVIKRIIIKKKSELFSVFMLLIFMLVFMSCLMYYAEHGAQPDKFTSIPATMWWGIATLSTVGYGDMYPITPIGQLLGSFVALIGIGFFALPAGILSSAFSEELSKQKKTKKGQTID